MDVRDNWSLSALPEAKTVENIFAVVNVWQVEQE
jgi:hypothetical protein